MHLGRVIGSVVSTAKYEPLVGHKLLVLQPIDASGNPDGRTLVAIDSVGAGAGEIVIWCRGKESSFPFLPRNVPSDCSVVGIVDSVFADRTGAEAS
ncbi:MAG: EutN/CcmL family microcompartment protein [Acidobacteria bacterium]|nr:EutN/CcmL family microcompartment protein [Acidobacteriota bacterium]